MAYTFLRRGNTIVGRVAPTYITTYIPNPLTWTDTGSVAPDGVDYSTIMRIGSTLYSFGGLYSSAVSNKIFTSAYSDGLNWVEASRTLPEACYSPHIILLGTTLYMFGSGAGTIKIHTASTSNPTIWTDTGATLPKRDNAPIALVGNKIAIFFGYNGGGTNTVIWADKSAPLVWNTTTIVEAIINWESGIFVKDNIAYVAGGDSQRITIEKFNTDLTACTSLDNVLQYHVSHVPICADIGTKVYILGGFDNNYSIQHSEFGGSPANPGTVWEEPWVSPSDFRYRSDMMWVNADGYMFTVDYGNRKIYRSGRTEILAQTPAANDSSPIPATFTSDGSPTEITRTCRLGFKSWLTDRTDMILEEPDPLPPWTPADLNPEYWFDPADEYTTVVVGSEAISTWTKRTGTGAGTALTMTAPNQPTRVLLDGKRIIQFDRGGFQYMQMLSSVTFGSVFVVAQYANGANVFFGYDGLVTGVSGGDNPEPFVGNQDTGIWYSFNNQYTDGTLTANAGINSTHVFDYSRGASPPTLTGLQVGKDRSWTDRYWNGWIGDIIIYPTILSTSDRNLVREYLMTKWEIPMT